MRTIKSLVALVAFLATSTSLMAAFPKNGDGSEANPYKIGTASELNSVRDVINTAAGQSEATACYELTADIVVTNTAWVGIGRNTENPFRGKFNGNGFKITGIKAGKSATSRANWTGFSGLFWVVSGVTISNLEVDVAYFIANEASISASGLIAQIIGGDNLINNCKVTGTIDAFIPKFKIDGTTAITNATKASGIVGQIGAPNSSVTIINTGVDATISASHESSNAWTFAAAFVAEPAAKATVNIVNCYATGSVISKNAYIYPSSKAAFAGGIIASGYNSQEESDGARTIINCYVSNSVEGYVSVGGISGSMGANSKNKVTNCIALNPKIIGGEDNTAIYRISTTGGGTFSDNFALNNIDIKAGVEPVRITSLINGAHGETISESNIPKFTKNKLNAYVKLNPAFNGITLKTWSDGTTNPIISK